MLIPSVCQISNWTQLPVCHANCIMTYWSGGIVWIVYIGSNHVLVAMIYWRYQLSSVVMPRSNHRINVSNFHRFRQIFHWSPHTSSTLASSPELCVFSHWPRLGWPSSPCRASRPWWVNDTQLWGCAYFYPWLLFPTSKWGSQEEGKNKVACHWPKVYE